MIGPTSWLLLTLTIQVTFLALAIYVIQKLAFARNPKAAARLIAFGMVLLLAVSAAATLPVPSWLDLLSKSTEVHTDDQKVAAVRLSLASNEPSEISSDPVVADLESADSPIVWGDVVRNVASEFSDGATANESSTTRSMTWNGVVCFGVCFLSLCVFGFARLLLGFVALRKLRNSSETATDEATLAMSKDLCERIGCDREIEIFLSPLVGTAATIGFWNPKVFLAGDFQSWELSEQESVLAHEIAHIHHGDFAANIVSQICTSMHFFNPIIHWLVAQMRLNQEVAADQVASQVTAGTDEYTKTLASLALRQDDQNQIRLASMFIPNQNSFVRRIKMLQIANRNGAATASWMACFVSLIAAFAISGVRAPATAFSGIEPNKEEIEATQQEPDGGANVVAGEPAVDDQVADDGEESTDELTVAQKKYLPARLKSVGDLIRNLRNDVYDEARYQEAKALIDAVISVDPDNIRAKVNLVDLYLTCARSFESGTEKNVENLKLGRKWLESLTDVEKFTHMEQVMAMPQLVDTCAKLGDADGAKQALEDAASKVMGIAKINPEIYEIWFSLVQSATVLKDYERATEFIKTAYQTVKGQETRRKIMQLASLVYVRNADDFTDLSKEENFRFRLYALCKAIKSNPRDVKIYDRLVEYMDVEADFEQRDVWLRNSILNCPIPAVIHILIGTREMIRGDVVAGNTSWDIAQHQFGTTEFFVHRLLSVAIRKVPEYGEGGLLDSAILHFPGQYMLYETRGAKKKREAKAMLLEGREEEAKQKFDEVIDDLKTVLEKVPDLITTHKHLEDCYEKIGDAESMAFHAKRVQELLSKIDEKQRELYEKVLNKL